jgi:hypothetical protein
MNRAIVALLLLAGMDVITGCEASNPIEPSGVRGLTFTASTLNPTGPTFDLKIDDSVTAQNIYAATEALPLFPPGHFNCPGDLGTRYSIIFFMASSTVATAVLNPSGCQDVTITASGDKSVRGVRDQSYWSTLASNLGLPESKIYPQ